MEFAGLWLISSLSVQAGLGSLVAMGILCFTHRQPAGLISRSRLLLASRLCRSAPGWQVAVEAISRAGLRGIAALRGWLDHIPRRHRVWRQPISLDQCHCPGPDNSRRPLRLRCVSRLGGIQSGHDRKALPSQVLIRRKSCRRAFGGLLRRRHGSDQHGNPMATTSPASLHHSPTNSGLVWVGHQCRCNW